MTACGEPVKVCAAVIIAGSYIHLIFGVFDEITVRNAYIDRGYIHVQQLRH